MHTLPSPPPTTTQAKSTTNLAVLDRVSQQLQPLWQALSHTATLIETEIKSTPHEHTAATPSAAARLLPQRALPVLPLLEAYFVLCDASMAQQAVLDRSREAGVTAAADAPAVAATPAPARTASLTAGGAGGGALASAPPKMQTPVHEGQLPFLRYGWVEQNTRVLCVALGVCTKMYTTKSCTTSPLLLQYHLTITTNNNNINNNTIIANKNKNKHNKNTNNKNTNTNTNTNTRFAEQHRRLLNAYVRHTPSLLESSLRLLLKVPRLVEFDNKRAYFRGRVRASHDERCVVMMGDDGG